MGKFTNPAWWAGKTPEQQARRDKARAGMREAREDMRRATDDLRSGIRDEREALRDDLAANRAEGAERVEQARVEGREQVQRVLDDREGRTLGGWGRKRR